MAAESRFSSVLRDYLNNSSYQVIRVETREDDGLPDLLGYHTDVKTSFWMELKSTKVNTLGKISLNLQPAQRQRLRWLSRTTPTFVLVELSDDEVLFLQVRDTVWWQREVNGSRDVGYFVLHGGLILPWHPTVDRSHTIRSVLNLRLLEWRARQMAGG